MVPSFRKFASNPRGLLLLGLMVREIFSFWTGHPYDFEVWLRNAFFVSQGANPYSVYMPPVPGLSFAYLHDTLPGVGYLPLWPIMVAGLYRLYSIVPGGSRFIMYFLLKQPPIFGDVALGFLVYRALRQWGGRSDVALRGLRYWMFFPYAILISALWGQFDAIVAALFLLFLLTDRSARGYVFVGVGILLKWLPLIYVPFLAFAERRWRKLHLALALIIPPLATIGIMASMGWDYAGITAMSRSASHGGGGGLTYVNIFQAPALVPVVSSIPGLYLVLGFMWVTGSVLAGFVASRRFAGTSPRHLVQSFLLILTVFFLTRFGVYEQYLIYFLPLFYVDVVLWHPDRRALLLVTWILAFAYLLVNNDMLLRFFGPIDSRAVDIAYAFDNQSAFAPLRVWGIYVIEVLFTVHLIQLVRVFLNPARQTTPWVVRPFRWLLVAAKRSVPSPGEP